VQPGDNRWWQAAVLGPHGSGHLVQLSAGPRNLAIG
jgi:hypothetical protein